MIQCDLAMCEMYSKNITLYRALQNTGYEIKWPRSIMGEDLKTQCEDFFFISPDMTILWLISAYWQEKIK
jgi:hypothetical protein